MFIVKVPFINGLGKTKGCERAGNAILESLKEIYTNESGKEIDTGKLDLEEIHVDNGNVDLSNKLIYKNSFETFETKDKVIFLGGDHSISYSIGKAFMDCSKENNKEPCLIVFDAHADCMAPVDNNFPTHEEWLRALIEAGFPVENILIVGARNIYKDEREFLKQKEIRIIGMNQLQGDLEDTCDIIMEFANGKELYLSIDIDVIDPSYAPSTGYKEPGGLSPRDLIYLIQRINKIKNLKVVDMVEINSEEDLKKQELTVKLGAKILSELL